MNLLKFCLANMFLLVVPFLRNYCLSIMMSLS
jgi:hypothetical protein